MPVGKELGGFKGKFTSIRTIAINGDDDRVIEGTYEAKVTGKLSGIATGTMTFSGANARGTFSDLGVGYLDSGKVLSGKGQGVYWKGKKGSWEIRGAFMLSGQMLVSEGQVTMSKSGEFGLKGKIFELK